MKNLILALIGAILIAGSCLTTAHEPEVPQECILVAYSEDPKYNFIFIHDGFEVLWTRPIFREVTESGEFGSFYLSRSYDLWILRDDGENPVSGVRLAVGPTDRGGVDDFNHCLPDGSTFAAGGKVLFTLYRATRETLCRPLPHAVEASGTKVHSGPTNYAECVQKVAAEDHGATVAQWKAADKKCESRSGSVLTDTPDVNTWISCKRSEMVKLPGIGEPAGGWRTIKPLAVCRRERFRYKMSDELVVGKMLTHPECFYQVKEKYPNATYAQWYENTKECWRSQGDLLEERIATNSWHSCRLNLCEGKEHVLEGTYTRISDTDSYEECSQLVLGTYPDADGVCWGRLDGAAPRRCIAKFGPLKVVANSHWVSCEYEKNMPDQYEVFPDTLMKPKYSEERESATGLGLVKDIEECHRLATLAYPTFIVAVVAPTEGGLQCWVTFRGFEVTSAVEGTTSVKDEMVRRRSLIEDRSAKQLDMGNAESLDECANIVRSFRPFSNGVSYDKVSKTCFAIPEMAATDASTYDARNTFQSAMLPATAVVHEPEVAQECILVGYSEDPKYNFIFVHDGLQLHWNRPIFREVTESGEFGGFYLARSYDNWVFRSDTENTVSEEVIAKGPVDKGGVDGFMNCLPDGTTFQADGKVLFTLYRATRETLCRPLPHAVEASGVRVHGGPTNYAECVQKVAYEFSGATVAQFDATKKKCESKTGTVLTDTPYWETWISCKRTEIVKLPGLGEPAGGWRTGNSMSVCRSETKRYPMTDELVIGKTMTNHECFYKIKEEYPTATYAEWEEGGKTCLRAQGDPIKDGYSTSNWHSCRLNLCEGKEHVLSGGTFIRISDTDSYEECSQLALGTYPDADGVSWGRLDGAVPRRCDAKWGTFVIKANNDWVSCEYTKGEPGDYELQAGQKFVPIWNREKNTGLEIGVVKDIEECHRLVGIAYPQSVASIVKPSEHGLMCTINSSNDLRLEAAEGYSSIRDKMVRQRSSIEDRTGKQTDMGNAESLDECATIVRSSDPYCNGVSYDKVSKTCFAISKMSATDASTYDLRNTYQSAMLPATTSGIAVTTTTSTKPPIDYIDPKNVNLELFYAQELTTTYCGEVTCPYHPNEMAQLAKQESLKREIHPLFKELSEEYASLKVGYLEFADKPVHPFGQANKDWCSRFLNSMTPYNDAYKAWVGDHWKRTWGSPPSGSDYVENQLDAAITGVLRGDFSTEDFDAEGKLNLRVLFMVTDKGFHVAGDVAEKGLCDGEGGCKDYVPSDSQCQCAGSEYPSVEQTIDVIAERKVNTLIYLGGEVTDHVRALYDSVHIKLAEENPNLQGVTVAPNGEGIHEFSPELFRQGLSALHDSVALVAGRSAA